MTTPTKLSKLVSRLVLSPSRRSQVGYGDITPTTDLERKYTTAALLLGAFVFAYILGDISAVVATLDRQASLVEEKMDSVKEYLEWRGIPKSLSLRVRRYYEYFYTQQAVFDERSILSGLSKTLHAEVVHCILQETLERIPLFARVAPDFRLAIFPHLKPMSVERHETIFERGSVSFTLFFLIKGEVLVLGGADRETPLMKLMPSSEIGLAPDGTPEHKSPTRSEGCFGQECLLGRRRETTHKAKTPCEPRPPTQCPDRTHPPNRVCAIRGRD